MADEWQSAWVEVLPDFKNFRTEANRQMTGILGGAGAVGAGSFSNSFVGGLGKFAFVIAGAIATLGISNLIADAVSAGIDQVQAAVGVASDLNESGNAIKVSFGDAAGEIGALGETAAKRLGLSNLAFNELATRFSGFAGSIAGEGGDVVGFIDELTTRGADFASVYNLEVADALTLFQSGLAGETEPLRRYGVDLSAAATEAFALANGIGEAGKPLSEAQKQQARYGLLLAETSKSAGDFQNTSGELANQQRILASNFENAQAKLGTALLPALTDLAVFANEELVPILNDLVEEVGPVLGEALKESAPALKDLVLALAPLLPQLVELAADALPVFVQLLEIAAPLLVDMAASSASFFQAVDDIFKLLNGDITMSEFAGQLGGLGGAFGEQVKAAAEFGARWGEIFGDVRRNVTNFVNVARSRLDSFIQFFHDLPGSIRSALGDLGATLYGSGRSLIQGFIDGVNAMFKPVGDAVGGLMDFVSGFFPNSPAERGPFSGAGWRAIGRSAGAIEEQFSAGFGSGINPFGSGVSLPRVPAFDTASAAATPAAPASSGVRDVILQNPDPMVLLEMFNQRVGGKLRLS